LLAIQKQQEELRRRQEEQEQFAAEEKAKAEEEERNAAEEARRKEEQKALKKQKEKEKIEELKKAGKYLSPAQKKANARNEQKLQQMRAAGIKVDALDEGEAEKKKTASEKKRTGRKNEKVGLPRTGHNRRLADMPFSPD